MSLLRPRLQAVLPTLSKTLVQRNAISTTPSSQFLFKKNQDKTTAFSSLLSDDNAVYEVVVEDVIPKEWDAYLKHKAVFMEISNSHPEIKRDLIASWRYIYGDVNFRAMHVYRYPKGWTDIDETRIAIKKDSEFLKEQKVGFGLISRQESEFLKTFSFWPVPVAREGNNIYDVRSYKIRPGSMYDWANYWSRGIRCRTSVRDNIPFAGFFTQLGTLHTVYHIWCYKDLADRKRCRETTWAREGWNDVVSNTVPLVTSMKTRILEPLEFSPTK